MSEHSPIDIQLAAEASIIGSVLFKRELIADLGMITASHFVDKAHAAAWRRLIDDSSIDNELSLQLGATELTDAHIRRIMSSRHARNTVIRARDHLIEKRRTRELRRVASEAMAALDDGSLPTEQIAINLRSAIQSLDTVQTASLPANVVATNLHAKGNSKPISSGLQSLDYVLHGGLHLGSLTGIFARYKHGKSLMAATIANNLEKAGVPTLLITLERRQGDLERFIIARSLNVDKQDLDFENPENIAFWEEYLATERCLHYLHRPGITADELRSQILAAHFALGVKVIIVDYWQLIRILGGKDSKAERQAESAQMLADLASDLDLSIVVTGQLNQDGHPYGGEGILAAAGIVVRIQRPDNQENVFFDTLVSNQGPDRVKGNPQSPAATISLPGPHFEDFTAATA